MADAGRLTSERVPAGMFSRVIPGMRKALGPIAPRLVSLTLQFRLGTSSQTRHILLLLLACDALRRLTFVNLDLTPGVARLCSAPSYTLDTLTLDQIQVTLGLNDLSWLLGWSAATLASLAFTGHPPHGGALQALPRLAPALKRVSFNITTDSDGVPRPMIHLTR